MTPKRKSHQVDNLPDGSAILRASKACSHIVFWHGIADREDDRLNPRRLIAEAQTRVLISGITLTYVLKDCADALERALRRGVEFDLVLADDNETSHRWYQHYSSEVAARLPIAHALARRLLKRLPEDLARRIRIHLASVPMTHSVGWYDDQVFVSEFCLGKDASAVPSYCLPKGCDSYEVFTGELLQTIATARPLSIVRLITVDCWDTLLANDPAWDDAIRRRIGDWLRSRGAPINVASKPGDDAATRDHRAGFASSRPLAILAVATEWESRHGGLSTLNRNLCVALRAAGHRVVCSVPEASNGEIAEARSHGVELRSARPSHGATARELLMRRPSLPDDFAPDVVIGHGLHTGPAARVWVEDYFGSSLRVHFVHTAPGEGEIFKLPPQGTTASAKAERKEYEERSLANTAGVVVAVGPKLRAEIATHLAADTSAPPVHMLTPGLDASVSFRSRSMPPNIHCLFLGRAEDLVLKGLDIATRAMASVANTWTGQGQLVFVVRGASPGTGDALHEQLVQMSGLPRSAVRIREYTPDEERLGDDLRKASVVLMPSRSEGFGLVGLEAISAGVPILISRESGLGQALTQTLGVEAATKFVVPVADNLEVDTHRWAEEIRFKIRDRETSFAQAAELRDRLSGVWSWDVAVGGLIAEIERQQRQRTPGPSARVGAKPLSGVAARLGRVEPDGGLSRLEGVFKQEAEWFRRKMQENPRIADPSGERVRFILTRLGIEASQAELEELSASIQAVIWDPPPAVIEGAQTFLECVRARGLHTCLISNTGWFSGPTVKQALEERGLARYLSHMVFADEVGCGKPGREIFERALAKSGCAPRDALHIGDDPHADVSGAIEHGMSAIHLARVGEPEDSRCPSLTSYEAIRDYLKAAGILT